VGSGTERAPARILRSLTMRSSAKNEREDYHMKGKAYIKRVVILRR